MKLHLVVDVDHDTDPALTDPHEIGEHLVAAYNEDVFLGDAITGPLTFVEAHWDET